MSEIRTRESKNKPITEVPLEVKDKSAEDKLLEYIENQIQIMQEKSRLGAHGDVTIQEINDALLNYTTVLWDLTAIYVVARQEQYNASEAFKDFQARKHLEARDILNPPSLSAQKWYSVTEIDSYVRTHWRDEYKKLRDELQAADLRLDFANKELIAWEEFKWCLSSLMRGLVAEVNNFGSGARELGLNQYNT